MNHKELEKEREDRRKEQKRVVVVEELKGLVYPCLFSIQENIESFYEFLEEKRVTLNRYSLIPILSGLEGEPYSQHAMREDFFKNNPHLKELTKQHDKFCDELVALLNDLERDVAKEVDERKFIEVFRVFSKKEMHEPVSEQPFEWSGENPPQIAQWILKMGDFSWGGEIYQRFIDKNEDELLSIRDSPHIKTQIDVLEEKVRVALSLFEKLEDGFKDYYNRKRKEYDITYKETVTEYIHNKESWRLRKKSK